MKAQSCGCCEGATALTPEEIGNRPGLDALSYRAGTYASFLETMLARLVNLCLETDAPDGGDTHAIFPLQVLATRAADDPAIAMLHAWATVGDVLTFYQERIANEGFLRTATERRSVLELARLVGYRLRPGVAASAFLAFYLDKGYSVDIPAGTRAQSIPGPGELPQSFETSEPLPARAEWNELKPRTSRPQYVVAREPDVVETYLFNVDPQFLGDLRFETLLEALRLEFQKNEVTLSPNAGISIQQAVWRIVDDDKKYLIRRTNQKFEVLVDNVCKFSIDPQVVDFPGFEQQWKALRWEFRKHGVTLTVNAGISVQQANSVWRIVDGNTKYVIRKKDQAFNVFVDNIYYFDGITTNLAPNDPLLFLFGEEQRLRRIKEVEIQVAQNRTKVLSLATSANTKARESATASSGRLLVGVDQRLAALLDLERYGVDEQSERVQWIRGLLVDLQATAAVAPPAAQLRDTIMSLIDQMSGARAFLPAAASKQKEWIDAIILTLQEMAASSAPAERATTRQSPSTGVVATAQVTLQSFDRFNAALIEKLTTAPSKQPFSSLQLSQDVRDVWVTNSASVTQLVPILQPALSQNQYYAALANTQTTPPSALQRVEALRIKAAPFGHNAPLKPVLNDKGLVIAREEWPLAELASAIRIRMFATGSQPRNVRDVFDGDFQLQGAGFPPIALDISLANISGVWNRQIAIDKITKQVDDKSTVVFAEDDIELDGFRIRVEVTYQRPTSGPCQLISIYLKFHRDGSELASVRIERSGYETGGFRLTIDTDDPRTVAQGGIVEYGIESRKVTMALDRDLLVIYHKPGLGAGASKKTITLDAVYERITPTSWVVILRPDRSPQFAQVESVRTVARADYGITGKVTQLSLKNAEWLDGTEQTLSLLRQTTIYAGGEQLTLADEPFGDDVAGDSIELDGLYGGLERGRWVIIKGERTDIGGVAGVTDGELAMIAAISEGTQQVPDATNEEYCPRPGDTLHTTIKLANKLSYTYKRDTVTIYGNVVKATHGETRKEVLGSGDGRQVHQRFTLKQKPLTYLAASSATGTASTLEVRVNDVLWREAENLFELEETDHAFVTQVDDEENTTVVFGDGQHGARLPSGVENIRAAYRNGIGQPGNVAADQISLLASRPLGVKSVINPLEATGGADRDSRDQARHNVPLGVTALDRLVSVRDYADFALTYAGIGKASAVRLSNGRRQVVHLTIAGLDDIRIDTNSDLYLGLTQALHKLGEPQQPVMIEPRKLLVLVAKAWVRLLRDYEWETTEPRIRSALLAAFGFDNRDLGQPVYCSELIGVIQKVTGVAYVDVDTLVGISEEDIETEEKLQEKLNTLTQGANGAGASLPEQAIVARLAGPDDKGRIRAAQLAIFVPRLPQTLMLEVIA